MDEVTFEVRLNELVSEFGGICALRHKKLIEFAKQVQENRKNFKKWFDGLEESLDVLRVYIKYQTFDLEATRRENQYLRKLLENSGGEIE